MTLNKRRKHFFSHTEKESEQIKRMLYLNDLLKRYLNGDVTDKEKQALDEYDIASHKELWKVNPQQAFTEKQLDELDQFVYEQTAKEAGFPTSHWADVAAQPDVAAIYRDMDFPRVMPKRRTIRPYSIVGAVGVAASVIVLVIALFVMRNTPEVYVADGSTATYTLSDETTVILNKGSRLTVSNSFNRNKREVEMTGEAFFDVTPNPDKPFIIRHGELTTEVKGTSFTIRSYPELPNDAVIVNTGRVSVSINASEIADLTRDKQFVFNKTTHSHHVTDVDADRYAQWQQGRVTLHEADIAELSLRLKQLFGKELVVKNNAFGKAVGINGVLDRNQTLDDVMKSFQLMFGFNYEITENSVVVDK